MCGYKQVFKDEEPMEFSVGEFFCIVAIVAVLSATSGCIAANHLNDRAAVEAGVGYWELDQRTGRTKFKYGVPPIPTVEGEPHAD